jgi:3-hydroxyisobutyrate dehydrogenase-like beta-hydroxyacid dehydrogenase
MEDRMTQPVGFIGLGAMGAPMARNLVTAGFDVRVFNRTAAKAQALAGAGARVVSRAAEAAESGGIVATMLTNDAALEEVVVGDQGIAASLGKGGVHISMSTISPETSRRLAAVHASHGGHYLAAPVFGRPEAAAARKLWICQSGPGGAKQVAKPVLEALGQAVYDFGEDPGAANVVKLCGNFLILSAIEAMAEAFALAEKNGVDRTALAALVGQTMFACPAYQTYGRIVAQRQYEPAGFGLALGLKDIKLVRDTAEAARVPMALSNLLHERLLGSLAKGRENLDWSAIELMVAEGAGLR